MRRRRPPRQVSRELNVTEDDFTFPKPEIWGARVSKSGPAVAPSNRAPRQMPRARPPHTTRPWARPHYNYAARPRGARGLLSRHAPMCVAPQATPRGAWPRAPARPSVQAVHSKRAPATFVRTLRALGGPPLARHDSQGALVPKSAPTFKKMPLRLPQHVHKAMLPDQESLGIHASQIMTAGNL